MKLITWIRAKGPLSLFLNSRIPPLRREMKRREKHTFDPAFGGRIPRTLVLGSLFFILIIAFAIHAQSISYYFFQDDWFVINLANVKNLEDFFGLFIPRTDIIYYRPLGMQLYFFLSKTFFGLNSLSFHLLSFSFFSLTIFLLYKFVLKLSSNNITAILSSFFYATAAFHYMSLSWLVLTWNYIGSSLLLLSLITFLNYLNKYSRSWAFCSIIFFILSLMASEFAIFYPLAILLLTVIIHNQPLFKTFKKSISLIIISGLILFFYFVLRIIIYPIPAWGNYKLTLSAEIIKNYTWYILWIFNTPEQLKYHFDITNFKLSSDILAIGKNLLAIIIVNLAILFTFLTLLLFKEKSKNGLKLLVLSTIVFIISLTPVIALPNHSYSYYLTTTSIPIIIFIAHKISRPFILPSRNKLKIIALIFILNWLILSTASVLFNHRSSWIGDEQKLSKTITSKAKQKWTKLPEGSTIFIYPSSEMVVQSLMNQEAFKVIYNRNIRTVYLEKENSVSSEDQHFFLNWTM